MIEKTELTDPTSFDELSDRDQKIVEDAGNAGKDLASSEPERGGANQPADADAGGIIEQTVDSKAVAGFGRPGDDSDVSGEEND